MNPRIHHPSVTPRLTAPKRYGRRQHPSRNPSGVRTSTLDSLCPTDPAILKPKTMKPFSHASLSAIHRASAVYSHVSPMIAYLFLAICHLLSGSLASLASLGSLTSPRSLALQSVQITHFVEDFLCVRKSRRLYFPAINFPAILFCDFCAFSRLSRVWLRLRRAVLLRVSAFTRCFLLGRGFAAL